MIEKLKRALYLLAKTRQAEGDARVDRDYSYKAMLDTIEGQEWTFCKNLVDDLTRREKKLYEMAATLAVATYDGENKKVAPGASVVDKKQLDTRVLPDEAVAVAWIKENAVALLKPDWEAFWTMVEAGLVPSNIARLEPRGTVPTARIDKNLSFLLEGE